MIITILYHGNGNCFDRFIIDPKLSNYATSSDLNEGYGVYMIEDRGIASTYGKYLYEVVVDEEHISDFTTSKAIRECFNAMQVYSGIPLGEYINFFDLCTSVYEGNIHVTKLYKEVCDILDSMNRFYTKFGDKVTYEADCILKKVEEGYYSEIKSVIKYNDKSFDKPLYICHTNPEILSIVTIKELS